MNPNDLHMLKTIILANGLSETLLGFSAICSAMSLEIAPHDAHAANRLMHASVELDGLSVDLNMEGIENGIMLG